MRGRLEPPLVEEVHTLPVPRFVVGLQYSPWLTIKKFIMLGLLIPGPDAILVDHIDVYLSPLIKKTNRIMGRGHNVL